MNDVTTDWRLVEALYTPEQQDQIVKSFSRCAGSDSTNLLISAAVPVYWLSRLPRRDTSPSEAEKALRGVKNATCNLVRRLEGLPGDVLGELEQRAQYQDILAFQRELDNFDTSAATLAKSYDESKGRTGNRKMEVKNGVYIRLHEVYEQHAYRIGEPYWSEHEGRACGEFLDFLSASLTPIGEDDIYSTMYSRIKRIKAQGTSGNWPAKSAFPP